MSISRIYSPFLVERCLYNLKGPYIAFKPAEREVVSPKDILFMERRRSLRRHQTKVEKGKIGRVSLVRYQLDGSSLYGVLEGGEWVVALEKAERPVPAFVLGCYQIDPRSYIVYKGSLWRLLGGEMEQVNENLSSEAMVVLKKIGVQWVLQEAAENVV